MKVFKERVVHPHESFRFMHMKLDRLNGERHRHPQAELTWVAQGSGLRFVGGSAAAVRPQKLSESFGIDPS